MELSIGSCSQFVLIYNLFETIAMGNHHIWICAKAIILKVIIIGDGAIEAARVVATMDFPAHSLDGGNPARVIRENVK